LIATGAAVIEFVLFGWEGVVRIGHKFRNLKGTSRAGAKVKGLHPAEAAPDRTKFVPNSGEDTAKWPSPLTKCCGIIDRPVCSLCHGSALPTAPQAHKIYCHIFSRLSSFVARICEGFVRISCVAGRTTRR
jgi:hypothetical protein